MSWIAKTATWMKEYKKKKYAVSCRQLGAPATKEGSYQLANQWWERRKAQIDGYATPPTPPQPGTPEAIHKVLEAWAGVPIQPGSLEEKATILDMMEGYKTLPPETRSAVQQAILGPERVAQLQAQVHAVLDAPPAPPGRSVQVQADGWNRQQQGRVAAGQLSPDRADANRNALAHFLSFTGPHADVDTLDAPRLQAFYLYCLERVAERRQGTANGWSMAFAKDVFSVAKSFVRWMWEQGTIELPRNLGSKAFKFGNGHKPIKTWTLEEYKNTVQEAPGKLKLGLLLMGNCGMTQQDVSDLKDTEVDWTGGRIIRQRSKTAGNENVPTVQYLLWPSTFALLQK
jgi:hypothetical protein